MRHRNLLLTNLFSTMCVLLSVALIPAQAQVERPSVDVSLGRLGPLAYPRTAMDPRGGTIKLEAPPQRIVSLSSNTDEYLYKVVPPEFVVGVSPSAYDEEFSNLLGLMEQYQPDVANDVATILRLEPDLVIESASSGGEAVYQLEAAGIPVFGLDTLNTNLEQVGENITVLGYITGQDEMARQERERFEREIAEIAEQCIEPHPEVSIFGLSMVGFSYGDQTLFHDLVRLVGGINVAARGGLHTYERIESEAIMGWNPEWVFTWSVPGKGDEELQRWMRDDPFLRLISAVEKKQIVVSDGKDLMPLSPFITTLAHTMADAICP